MIVATGASHRTRGRAAEVVDQENQDVGLFAALAQRTTASRRGRVRAEERLDPSRAYPQEVFAEEVGHGDARPGRLNLVLHDALDAELVHPLL